MTMYKYEAVIDNIDLPVGPGIPGKYSDTRTVWIEPLTGAIVKGIEQQKRWLADGTQALDTTLTFNQAAIDYQAKQASDGRAQIKQLTVILPLISLLVGLLALVGAFLLSRRPPAAGVGRTADAEPEPAGRR